jgi:RimJ/RimL family protein N-acetyltransferase
VICETERLRLRALAEGDAEFVLRLTSDPDFREHIGDKGVRDLDSARRFLRDGTWTNQTKPGHGQFRVEIAGTGEPVGVCGLLYRERLDLHDVGFALLPEHRGRGYALEAARAVVRYARETLGIDKVVGLTDSSNLASIRVLERLGLRYVRTVRMTDDDPGTRLYA